MLFRGDADLLPDGGELQSGTDPFIIITALPGALCGIAWMLFMTHTTFSVPSLNGRDHVPGGGDVELHPDHHVGMNSCARQDPARGGAGRRLTRLRPVLMTASR